MSYYLTSDRVKLNYHVYGNGRPIVLVTGFGGYQEIWTKQVSYLLNMGYQVITYDHRNMGESEKTLNGHTLQRLTDDLIGLAKFLNISHATFIAHSMGGSVLYDLIQTKPNLVDLACIVDQTPYMLNTKDWHFGFMNYTLENYKEQSKIIPEVHETLHGLDTEVFNELNLVKTKYPFDRQSNMDLLQEHIKQDWRNIIITTTQKIVVFAAKKSPYYNYQFAEWMAKHNSRIEYAVLDDCGHDIMAEVPRRFNQLLRHFLLKNRYLPE